jgi:Rps23 Pro-64 3,4-dihydroxylase Tpa1-like proline 4-hydroxylase
LEATISSFHVTDLLSKIVGCRYLIPREIFISNYGKDDFLSIHHDIKKGDIAVTFSLAYDWNPVYGGILHFCDKDNNIYKSVVPTLGSVNIFKLDPENGIDHFVSCVNVNKNRYTLTAWYDVIN